MVKEMATKREEKPKFPGGGSGRNLRDKPAKASSPTAMKGRSHPSTTQLMEAVIERSNLILALRRVESNAGSAGVDAMEVGELRGYLKEHWPEIKKTCWREGINRRRSGEQKSPSHRGECDSWAFPRW